MVQQFRSSLLPKGHMKEIKLFNQLYSFFKGSFTIRVNERSNIRFCLNEKVFDESCFAIDVVRNTLESISETTDLRLLKDKERGKI